MTRKCKTIVVSASLAIPATTFAAAADNIVARPGVNQVAVAVAFGPKKDRKANLNFGPIRAVRGSNAVDSGMVIGVEQKIAQEKLPWGANDLHWLNVVVSDPVPPKWKDAGGAIHAIGNEIYMDPLSGGNIAGNNNAPNPVADRNPWYDSESRNKASKAGTDTLGRAEYNMENWSIGQTPIWADPQLFNFSDAPTHVVAGELAFVTILVGVKDKLIGPIESIDWAYDGTNSNTSVGDFKNGGTYARKLTRDKIQDALKRSGFGEYTMLETTHPFEAPKKPKPDNLVPPQTMHTQSTSVTFDAGNRTLDFADVQVASTGFGSDVLTSATVKLPTFRLYNQLPDGTYLFGTTEEMEISIGSTKYLRSGLPLLTYDPADNSLTTQLYDYFTAQSQPGQAFHDPALTGTGSPWVGFINGIMDENGAMYDPSALFYLTFDLNSDLNSITGGFTQSASTFGIGNMFGGAPVPEPAAAMLLPAIVAFASRRHR